MVAFHPLATARENGLEPNSWSHPARESQEDVLPLSPPSNLGGEQRLIGSARSDGPLSACRRRASHGALRLIGLGGSGRAAFLFRIAEPDVASVHYMQEQPRQDLHVHWDDKQPEVEYAVADISGPGGSAFRMKVKASCRAQANTETKINNWFQSMGLPHAGTEVTIPEAHFIGF
jgi:hypothetical protein